MGSHDAIEELERARCLAAASRAAEAYPGALGELIHRELSAFVEFGHRLGGDGLIRRLTTEVLDEVDDPASAPSTGSPR
ncbi:hypothetical protein [Actinomycetospora aeridis]|uniref:Uncharacterized protein n=1 Tax=Actinomycetospora aeridis TaxID=3129231 RepID=A0ABU8N7U0_9PSEU